MESDMQLTGNQAKAHKLVPTHYPLADGFEMPPFAFAQMVLSE